MIAEAAYFRAANRGFAPGGELADWLAAERDLRGTFDASRAAQRAGDAIGAQALLRRRAPAETPPADEGSIEDPLYDWPED